MKRSVRVAIVVLLAATAPIAAREQKTVFHGLPVEPETEFERRAPAPPVVFERAWTFDGFTAPLAGDPAAAPPHVAAVDRSGRVALIHGETGKAIWTADLGETAAVGPSVDGGVLFAGTAAGNLVAIDVQDGALRWHAPLGGAPVAPPVVAGSRVLVVTDQPALVAIDPADGREIARQPLPGRPLAPLAADGRVVVGTDHGMVVAFDGGTLEVLWRRYLRHAVTAPPTVVGPRVFVATADRALWALRARSGRVSWRQRMGSIVTARPRGIGGYLYVSCWDNDVYVLEAGNGHLMSRARLDHRLSVDAALSFEHLLIAPFTEGSVVALALPYLGIAGRHELGVPGEWFTTAPVAAAGGVAVGWGRDAGRLMGLHLAAAPRAEPAPAAATPADPGGF